MEIDSDFFWYTIIMIKFLIAVTLVFLIVLALIGGSTFEMIILGCFTITVLILLKFNNISEVSFYNIKVKMK